MSLLGRLVAWLRQPGPRTAPKRPNPVTRPVSSGYGRGPFGSGSWNS